MRYKDVIQRKCGADFRLSIGRLWKDPVEEKRHNTPHSDRYGVRVRRTRPATGIYTKVSVVKDDKNIVLKMTSRLGVPTVSLSQGRDTRDT